MGIRLFSVVLDCADPHALARFYAQLLELAVTRDEPGWAEVGGGQAVRLSFQRVPGYQPPRWPDPAYPPHLHLDFQVGDIAAAEATVLALGGRRLPSAEPAPGPPFRVYADPEGHPFCLGWERVS
jgi:predicted enzyme related to lactoylglutathione lyase